MRAPCRSRAARSFQDLHAACPRSRKQRAGRGGVCGCGLGSRARGNHRLRRIPWRFRDATHAELLNIRSPLNHIVRPNCRQREQLQLLRQADRGNVIRKRPPSSPSPSKRHWMYGAVPIKYSIVSSVTN